MELSKHVKKLNTLFRSILKAKIIGVLAAIVTVIARIYIYNNDNLETTKSLISECKKLTAPLGDSNNYLETIGKELKATNIEKVIPACQEVLKDDPDNYDIHFLLGRALPASTNYPQAEEAEPQTPTLRNSKFSNSYNYIALFMSLVHIAVGFNNFFQRVTSVDNRFDMSYLTKLFDKSQIFGLDFQPIRGG